jgi:lactoylglutathione lyase
MNIGFITVKVRNMEESLKFYVEFLGLKEMIKFSPQPGINIVFLGDEKGNKLELIENSHENIGDNKNNILVSIGFPVDNVDNILDLVNKKQIEIVRGPIVLPNGTKFVYVKDPNGVEIEFIEGFNY